MNAYDTKLQHVLDEIRELLCERDGSPEFDSASECEEVDEVCGLRREELDEVCELPREHGGVPKFGSASECEEVGLVYWQCISKQSLSSIPSSVHSKCL